MGGRPAPERSAGPQGGADRRHHAHRGDTCGRGGMEPGWRPAACHDAGTPASDAPRLRLKSSINATPSARSVEAYIYRTETIFSQRKFGSRAHRQAAGHRARREPLTRCSPTERRFVGCPDLWHSGRFLDPRLLRSRRGPSMKRTPCSPSATPTGRRSVTSVSSGRDAQPRNGSPATRVLTYNAFVR